MMASFVYHISIVATLITEMPFEQFLIYTAVYWVDNGYFIFLMMIDMTGTFDVECVHSPIIYIICRKVNKLVYEK